MSSGTTKVYSQRKGSTEEDNLPGKQSRPNKVLERLYSDSSDGCKECKTWKQKPKKATKKYTFSELYAVRYAFREMPDGTKTIPGLLEEGLGMAVKIKLPRSIQIEKRKKQIDFGKQTIGYKNYTKLIPKDERIRSIHPSTPDYQNFQLSKRRFDGQVRAWRRSLHNFDDEESIHPQFLVHRSDLLTRHTEKSLNKAQDCMKKLLRPQSYTVVCPGYGTNTNSAYLQPHVTLQPERGYDHQIECAMHECLECFESTWRMRT